DGLDFGRRPVGSGPYRFASWSPGDRIVLERNDSYGGPRPAFRRLVFRAVPEPATRVALLESGAADVVLRLPPHERERLGRRGGCRVLDTPSVRVIYVGMNCRRPPLDDARVRRALVHAVDREAIVAHVLRGAGAVADGPVAPGVFGHAAGTPLSHDPARARALLAEAGWAARGRRLAFWAPVGRYLEDRTVAEAVREELRKVGVECDLEIVEWATYLERLRPAGKEVAERAYDLFLLGWAPSTGDADWVLRPLFHSAEAKPGGSNETGYANLRVDDLVVEAMGTADPEARRRAYAEAIRIVTGDAPWIPLHVERQITGLREGVEGVIVSRLELLDCRRARRTGP
ncbi:MAG: ABC transporter substrate-binding protein, partial [Planctomycetales bacterium]|nr:ABC transporter substrate-binding protein [Planctomycetales bacterium]